MYRKDALITVNFIFEINKVVVREFRLDVQASELVSSVKSTINDLMQYCWELLTFERWIELKLAFGADGDLDDKCPLHYYQIRDADIVRVLLRSPSTNQVMLLEAPARATQFFSTPLAPSSRGPLPRSITLLATSQSSRAAYLDRLSLRAYG